MTPNLCRKSAAVSHSYGFVDDIPEVPPRPKSAFSNHSFKEFKDFSK